MKKQLLIVALFASTLAIAQQRDSVPAAGARPMPGAGFGGGAGARPGNGGPRAFKDLINDKAISKKGLFTVHKVDEKYYFEIADSIIGREILAVTRFVKLPGGTGKYGGEQANEQSLRFEKGPNNNLFLRVVTLISVADSTDMISKAVKNSYLDPIANSFPIAALGKDSTSYLIDVTDFFKGDNQIVSLDAGSKRQFSLGMLSSDRSYIQTINTFPINTEVRTVKTFSASPGAPTGFGGPGGGGASIPAASSAGAVTIEMNTSLLLLPKEPMGRRIFDKRVGYFADNFVVFADKQQKVENQTFAVRYRLEPKPEDMQKYLRGELVEPAKQIVYYIDPATPKQWVKPLIDGINDWQVAFEKAGFKNAIVGKEWPNDPNMSLEDARFSVVRYFAADIENAYGPQIHDPRSGEILESHIGWYHNVMKLVHDWYLIQASASDPKARKMKFDDELMGQLIRFVSSHEVGHTLGLRHNMGSSSKTPVENLRNKAWVEANGHTVSIMDYARFNYVAQPEDNISQIGLFPRIGDYDKWAIEWGYKYLGADLETEKKTLSKLTTARLAANDRLWFGGEGGGLDPRAQTEDLGDNSMKASEYGIKNLKRVIAGIPNWSKEEGDSYSNLSDLYRQLLSQFQRYMGHVLKNVGGVYETFKTVETPGDIYEPTPKAIQKEAVAFLNKQLFETPYWMMDKNILNKIANPVSTESVQSIQTSILSSLIDGLRLNRLSVAQNRFGGNTYTIDELLEDVKKGVWSELGTNKVIDPFKRYLQKAYVEKLTDMVNPAPPAAAGNAGGGFGGFQQVNVKNTDAYSTVKSHLKSLLASINASAGITDKMSKSHLQDLAQRIKMALDPK